MANKVYQHDETAIVWKDSGATEVITLQNLATVTGRNGALHDFGTAARARRFAWRFWCQFETAPVVGEVVEIYLRTSDGANPDNDDGTGDVALSAVDKLRNLKLLGVLEVDEASITPVMACSGVVEIDARYAGPVIYNATTDNLENTANVSGFQLTPVPDEIQ